MKNQNKKTQSSLLVFVFLICSICGYGNTYYVKVDGTGDGSSWENAVGDLQAVLDSATTTTSSYHQIWIAEGVYHPSYCTNCTEEDRNTSFLITSNVHIYGGFPASSDCSTTIHDRDWVNHPTIFSGDIGLVGDPSDNSYHVISVIDTYMRINGITIQDGNAMGNTTATRNGGFQKSEKIYRQ